MSEATAIEEQTELERKPTNDFASKAKAIEEEHEEVKGWLTAVSKQAAEHNDSPDVLMKIDSVDWPEGCDTQVKRNAYVQKQLERENRLPGHAATMLMLSGVDGMVRDTDAFFETPEWSSFVEMKQAFAEKESEDISKARWAPSPVDPLLDPLFDEIKKSNSGRYSKAAFINFLKSMQGVRKPDENEFGEQIEPPMEMTGFKLRTGDMDEGGLKAMLLTGGPEVSRPGVEPLPMMMDRITQLAQRRPALFYALPQMSMTEKSYVFREETQVRENVGYTTEIATRADTNRQTDLTIQSFSKALLSATSYMSATYEQLEYEPLARNLMRTQLIGGMERWLDREILGGEGAISGGTGQGLGTRGLEYGTAINRIYSLRGLTHGAAQPDAGEWTTKAQGNNHYRRSANETDLRAILHAKTHMQAEDYGMSMPTHILMTPYAYEEMISVLVNNTVNAGIASDARWLFPTVLQNGSMTVQPFGLPVLQIQNPSWTDPFTSGGSKDAVGDQEASDQEGIAHTEAYMVDMTHLLFRSHSSGMAVEVDRHPRRAIEEIVARTSFQFDVWRRLAVHRVSGLSFNVDASADNTPAGEDPTGL